MSSRPSRKDAWLPYLIVGGCALLALSIAAFGTLSLVSLGRDTPPDKAMQGTTVLIGQPTAQPGAQLTAVPVQASLQPTAMPIGTPIPFLQITPPPSQVPGGSAAAREPTRPAQAAATSVPAPASAPAPSVRAGTSTYKVAAGDTLGKIAAQHGVSVQTLLQINKLSDSDLLKIGQEIVIPATDGLVHEVKAGDTVMAIARLYGVGVEDIGKANGLDSSYNLRVGQQLVIPGGTRPAAAPPAPVATRTPAAPAKPRASPTVARRNATPTPASKSAPTPKPAAPTSAEPTPAGPTPAASRAPLMP